jgi:hypothetical protein
MPGMRSSRTFTLGLPLLVPVILASGGCPDRTIAAINPQQQGAVTKAIPTSADIDILFVIDNSNSTSDKQAVFLANMGSGFVNALDMFPTGRPNLHIAVVNSTTDIGNPIFNQDGCPSPDPGDNGLMRNTQGPGATAGCPVQTGQFISDISDGSGGRTTNYPASAQLQDVLQCIGAVGTGGCGFETQLEAMKRALDGTNPQNAGFLRDGAYLAVIILTDEDDASTKDPAVYSLPNSQVGGLNDYRVQPMFAYTCDQTIQASSGSNYTNCKPSTGASSMYLQDPAFYSQFLSGVKNPAQTVVAVIAGPPPGLLTNDNPPQMANAGPTAAGSIVTGPIQIGNNPVQMMALEASATCTVNGTANTVARPALRLASFLSAYGTSGRFYNVCQSDYTAALADIGNTLFNAISPCLEGDINTTDADPNNPGVQLQCTVTDTQQVGSGQGCPDGSAPNNGECQEQIPICKMTNPTTPASGQGTCAWFQDDSSACPAPNTGYELTVVRASAPPTGTVTDVECAVNTTNGSSS